MNLIVLMGCFLFVICWLGVSVATEISLGGDEAFPLSRRFGVSVARELSSTATELSSTATELSSAATELSLGGVEALSRRR